jgi:hypothetical protein
MLRCRIIMSPTYEYRLFIYDDWPAGAQQVAYYGSPSSYTLQLAREAFWERFGSAIQQKVTAWQADGWESTERIGMESLHLHESQIIDESIHVEDVLLWFMTFGLAFLLYLFNGSVRHYVTYRPLQFRVEMRRTQPVRQTQAA